MRSQKNTIRLMKTNLLFLTLVFVGCASIISCGQSNNNNRKKDKMENQAKKDGLELATFGTGCFWCTEAVFESLEGVADVVSGYEGGHVKNPTYKEVCTGTTGHAECVQVTYDPKKISYTELLQAFFRSHDPTSLNRQGADVGTQYRSAIFYHTDEQKKFAEEIKNELDKSGAYPKPIVTEIVPTETFYVAEDYHQDYFANNPEQGYCAAVIAPKLEKFRKVFHDKLKKN
jgi:peptide-methionine (S)-S-oxide reductase